MAKDKVAVTSDMGVIEGKLVQFLRDIAPYCKDDIVRLDSEAEKYVAARVKALGLDGDVFSTKVKPVADHTEGNQGVVVGSVSANAGTVLDQPTTVHGGTVVNEQNAPTDAQKPTDTEVKDRTANDKNPRG